ncbi:MAG: hypothetical protein M1504_03390 [Candidatus Marsarchaeota archaeon]|nr:hypothetical protein [Candidatus Marsarchaeota archaeon]
MSNNMEDIENMGKRSIAKVSDFADRLIKKVDSLEDHEEEEIASINKDIVAFFRLADGLVNEDLSKTDATSITKLKRKVNKKVTDRAKTLKLGVSKKKGLMVLSAKMVDISYGKKENDSDRQIPKGTLTIKEDEADHARKKPNSGGYEIMKHGDVQNMAELLVTISKLAKNLEDRFSYDVEIPEKGLLITIRDDLDKMAVRTTLTTMEGRFKNDVEEAYNMLIKGIATNRLSANSIDRWLPTLAGGVQYTSESIIRTIKGYDRKTSISVNELKDAFDLAFDDGLGKARDELAKVLGEKTRREIAEERRMEMSNTTDMDEALGVNPKGRWP